MAPLLERAADKAALLCAALQRPDLQRQGLRPTIRALEQAFGEAAVREAAQALMQQLARAHDLNDPVR
jgi:hypothetical protein